MTQYRILTAGTLDAGIGFQRPHQSLPDQVSLDSPAIDVMTDLSQVTAETVSANLAVDNNEGPSTMGSDTYADPLPAGFGMTVGVIDRVGKAQ